MPVCQCFLCQVNPGIGALPLKAVFTWPTDTRATTLHIEETQTTKSKNYWMLLFHRLLNHNKTRTALYCRIGPLSLPILSRTARKLIIARDSLLEVADY